MFVFGECIMVEGVEEDVSFYGTILLAALITGFGYSWVAGKETREWLIGKSWFLYQRDDAADDEDLEGK